MGVKLFESRRLLFEHPRSVMFEHVEVVDQIEELYEYGYGTFAKNLCNWLKSRVKSELFLEVISGGIGTGFETEHTSMCDKLRIKTGQSELVRIYVGKRLFAGEVELIVLSEEQYIEEWPKAGLIRKLQEAASEQRKTI